MNDTVQLLSSMSPKIKNKLKPGEEKFRRSVSILALKKNIRRSSFYEKPNVGMSNNCDIVEYKSNSDSYESLEHSDLSERGSKHKESIKDVPKSSSNNDDSIIVISDSASNSGSEKEYKKNVRCFDVVDVKTENEHELPKEKIDAISNWIEQVNIQNNKTSSTVYTELSTICPNDLSNNFVSKTEDHAVNSTFAQGCNKKFDEMFAKKNNIKKADETESIKSEDVVDNSLKNMVIDDSFEVLNVSLKTRLKANKQDSKVKNEKVDTNISNDIECVKKVETTQMVEEQIENDFILVNNKQDMIDVPGSSDEESSCIKETHASKLLDELYGTSWRANKDLVLCRTEPRNKTKKPSIKPTIAGSERKPSKPKASLLYKNPYLDSQRSTSSNLLGTLHRSRLNEPVKLPWMNTLKTLCDSDTNSENSPKPIHPTHLEFDESSDEEKQIKNKSKTKENGSDKENRSNKLKNIYLNDYVHANIEKRTKSNSKSGSSSTTSSFEKVQFVTTRKPVKPITDNEIGSSADMIVCRRSVSSVSITSDDDLPVDQKPKVNNKIKPAVRKKQSNKISDSDDSDVIKPKSNKKTGRKVIPSIEESAGSSSSDEEWDKEVSKIERRTKPEAGSYSFLASLSAGVPIFKCDMAARIFRNNFKSYKDQLVKKLFQLYNEKVFDNVLPQDMQIEWNDRMRKTAGYCYCKKITRKTGNIERSARIVLSAKVVDRADRLRDTLIHELCHAATWMVNCVPDGHGDHWKSWAFKAMKTFPELPVIKRCHNYVINTKYTYRCTGCGYSIGRHSKSLDIERKRCGKCYGKFEVLINKTNKNGETRLVAATPKKEATGFALFVKENYSVYKSTNTKHGDVMKILSQKFQAMKVDVKL